MTCIDYTTYPNDSSLCQNFYPCSVSKRWWKEVFQNNFYHSNLVLRDCPCKIQADPIILVVNVIKCMSNSLKRFL